MKELRILDEEWNVLIVLDACRFDAFQVCNTITGELEVRRSLGSCTEEWFNNNFIEVDPKKISKSILNIVYISGNPWVSEWKIKNKLNSKVPFHTLIEVWDWAWDSKRKCVPPEPVTRASIEAIKKYKNKRFIIHYLQPHFPFLRMDMTIGRGLLLDYLQDKEQRFLTGDEVSKIGGIIWHYIGKELSVEEAREGYVNNVLYVLEEVKKLIKEIPKNMNIKITADHGEMLGYDKESFGHGFIDVPSLREVPWFKVSRT